MVKNWLVTSKDGRTYGLYASGAEAEKRVNELATNYPGAKFCLWKLSSEVIGVVDPVWTYRGSQTPEEGFPST